MTDKVKNIQEKETNRGWGVGKMREIDIQHVMSGLGIQQIAWQRWQSKQMNENEVDRTYKCEPKPCLLLNNPHTAKFHFHIHMEI